MKSSKTLHFQDEFSKFIKASKTGQRLMPSGKKVRKSTFSMSR